MLGDKLRTVGCSGGPRANLERNPGIWRLSSRAQSPPLQPQGGTSVAGNCATKLRAAPEDDLRRRLSITLADNELGLSLERRQSSTEAPEARH